MTLRSTHASTSVPRVSFQGAPGAFSELAILQQWPDGALPIPQPTFVDAVECALRGDADFAVIPVENAIAGPVYAALSALDANRDRLIQCDSITLLVSLCLMACDGSDINELRIVLSHPMALAQCTAFFAAHPWLTATVHGDTASAAHEVATRQLPGTGAIASEAAAKRYGLNILARDMQDRHENWTRFVVLRA